MNLNEYPVLGFKLSAQIMERIVIFVFIEMQLQTMVRYSYIRYMIFIT
jgi:hypothetical protein